MPEDKSNIPYTLRQLEERHIYDLEQWFKHITKGKEPKDNKKPINLPTNLFDETIIKLLQNEINKQNVQSPQSANYNELFKIWWKAGGDKTQSFYKAEREYLIYKESVKFKLKEGAKFADLYQEPLERAFRSKQSKRMEEKNTDRRLPNIQRKQLEKVFKRTISKNEKDIRIIQEQDRIMLLMIEKLFDSRADLKLKLSNIDNLLNEEITISQSLTGSLSFNAAGEIIRDNKQKPQITKTITNTRKRKDYSMLYKYIYDRRLPELFEYFSDEIIPLNYLIKELESYNIAKQIVFDAAFKLEEHIVQKDKKGLLSYIDEEFTASNIQHKPYLLWLLSKKMISNDEYIFFTMIRNTFAHNQFPQKRTMELIYQDFGKSNYAEQIANYYREKIDTLISNM